MAFAKAMMDTKDTTLTLTENNALAYASTGNACLDLFFKMVRGLTTENLTPLLEAAWNECPEAVLRIIFHCRDCRGGKGEKKLFHQSLVWLHSKQPDVVLKNLKHIPFFGTWKDLLFIGSECQELCEPICRLFADQLDEDKRTVETAKFSTERPEISLCAKWAPTERHHFDSQFKFARRIAQCLPNSTDSHALVNYRKNYLVPLREFLRVTETFMCSKDWRHIPYPSVPSRCMHINKKAFIKNDKERFQGFLQAAMEGKTSIQGKQMFPHELVTQYMSRRREVDLVCELQWKSIIEPLRESGVLTSCLVLSDVSGSMSGTPMQVSIALGLMISELTAPPFQNLILTFESDPKFHQVQGETLMDRVRNVMAMSWGGSTDFKKALDLILNKAIQHRVPKEEMPQKLFVISDMQFDQADSHFMTDHEYLKQKWTNAGYDVPTMVYWNVRANTVSFPAPNENGTVLLSGYSPSLLKLVMEESNLDQQWDMEADTPQEKPKPNPMDILIAAISNERYDVLTL